MAKRIDRGTRASKGHQKAEVRHHALEYHGILVEFHAGRCGFGGGAGAFLCRVGRFADVATDARGHAALLLGGAGNLGVLSLMDVIELLIWPSDTATEITLSWLSCILLRPSFVTDSALIERA